MQKKLAIVVSHPIQYYAPLFKKMATEMNAVVFYGDNPSSENIGKSGFGISFQWDIDLFSGYQYEFYQNINSENSDLSSYKSVKAKNIGEYFEKHNITHCIIFGWYLKYYIQALKYCNNNNIKVAVRGDSQLNPESSSAKHFIKKLTYRFLLKKFDKILYVGSRNKEYLLTYGAKQKQLIYSPHAVDQELWKPNATNAKQNQKIKFLWVAKFINKKRPNDAISAFNKLSEKRNDIELIMVGTGPLLNESKKQANSNGNIKFLGFKNQTELKKIYESVNVLLLTSDFNETWGLVVNEAFSYNLPAIISNACGCSIDMNNEGKTGFTYHYKNVVDLTEKMDLIAENVKTNFSHKKYIQEKNNIHSYDNVVASFKTFLDS